MRRLPPLLLLLAACPAPPPPPPPPPAPPPLELTITSGVPLADGATIAAEAELRFTLRARARSFAVIAAALPGGEVLPLLPSDGEPIELEAGRALSLQESVTLPAGTTSARFVAVACDIRPPLEPVWATIAERLAEVGGDPAKLPPLALESCRDAQRLVRFSAAPR